VSDSSSFGPRKVVNTLKIRAFEAIWEVVVIKRKFAKNKFWPHRKILHLGQVHPPGLRVGFRLKKSRPTLILGKAIFLINHFLDMVEVTKKETYVGGATH
jgi:hypothetical protein